MHLITFSHLRWNFVYQRPQHLLSRFAKKYSVFYIEEHTFSGAEDGYSATLSPENVMIIVPHLKEGHTDEINIRLERIIQRLFSDHKIHSYLFWYYTPMALEFTGSFNPVVTVFDCMDELSAFKFAPEILRVLEVKLLQKADIVFTGGNSLYQAKKSRHHNIYSFPSSIDKGHFESARRISNSPVDQEHLPRPLFGFFGVIDERFDMDLIASVAELKPEWQFALIGPVVKIDPQTLPKKANIHYLGSKSYSELPAYVCGWDIALIPFAINESTRYISPTKTPEYLAAGKPVISTPIADVIDPYGNSELVKIVGNATEFIAAAESELAKKDKTEWLQNVDNYLATISWDVTFTGMDQLIGYEISDKKDLQKAKHNHYV